MANPNDYTVGWICAIATESVAAQNLLEKKHGPLNHVAPGDNNSYTLGEIGKHKVVIAVLPDGEYGTTAAANVARDMLHTFRNIRIGLMVGIGGGAWSRKHDIRLGDVVVSAPRNGGGGVLQYDFGKTIQNQAFQMTGFSNMPPMLLRTAVTSIRAKYEDNGHQLDKTIKCIIEKNPRLRKKYQRPPPSSDRLYQSVLVHPLDDELSCADVCGNDSTRLVERKPRKDDEENPAVHYGLVASANQLMKDALVRDRLAAEKNVLCFEMEAAGLMNHFPCLVIRGICDYSDTHKNKEWQGYAAMAAAAYAKDLLLCIAPENVDALKKIRELGPVPPKVPPGGSGLAYTPPSTYLPRIGWFLKSHVDSAIAADRAGLMALFSSGLENSAGTWTKRAWLLEALKSRGIVLMYPNESRDQYARQRSAVDLSWAQRFSAGVNLWVKIADSNRATDGAGGGYTIVARYSIQQLCWYLGVFK